MSIDSLPNYLLIEPIPVAIDPSGDAAYTAWVRNLDTNATGHSVVEALLLLKERIEFVYDDLAKRSHLNNEQKITLQMLHTYIAPKKPEYLGLRAAFEHQRPRRPPRPPSSRGCGGADC